MPSIRAVFAAGTSLGTSTDQYSHGVASYQHWSFTVNSSTSSMRYHFYANGTWIVYKAENDVGFSLTTAVIACTDGRWFSCFYEPVQNRVYAVFANATESNKNLVWNAGTPSASTGVITWIETTWGDQVGQCLVIVPKNATAIFARPYICADSSGVSYITYLKNNASADAFPYFLWCNYLENYLSPPLKVSTVSSVNWNIFSVPMNGSTEAYCIFSHALLTDAATIYGNYFNGTSFQGAATICTDKGNSNYMNAVAVGRNVYLAYLNVTNFYINMRKGTWASLTSNFTWAFDSTVTTTNTGSTSGVCLSLITSTNNFVCIWANGNYAYYRQRINGAWTASDVTWTNETANTWNRTDRISAYYSTFNNEICLDYQTGTTSTLTVRFDVIPAPLQAENVTAVNPTNVLAGSTKNFTCYFKTWATGFTTSFLCSNNTGSFVNTSLSVPATGNASTLYGTLVLNVTGECYVTVYFIVNSTLNYWGFSENITFYVWAPLPSVSKKDFGLNVNAGNSLYYNGTAGGGKDAIYCCFQNQSAAQWTYQVRAFDLNTSSWSLSYTVGNSIADGHYTPSISAVWDGRLIVFYGYDAPINYRVSTYSAWNTSSLATLLNNWGPEKSIASYGGRTPTSPDGLNGYPDPLWFNSSLVLFAREGGAAQGNYTFTTCNQTVWDYFYVNQNGSLGDWTGVGSQPYLHDHTVIDSDYITTATYLATTNPFTFERFNYNYNMSGLVQQVYLEFYVSAGAANGINVTFNGVYVGNNAGTGWTSLNITGNVTDIGYVGSGQVTFTNNFGSRTNVTKARLKVYYAGFSNWTTLVQRPYADYSSYAQFSNSGNNILASFNRYNYSGGLEENIYFAYSPDQSNTWKNVTGTVQTLPILGNSTACLIVTSTDRTRAQMPLLDENSYVIVPYVFWNATEEAFRLSAKLGLAVYGSGLGTASSWTTYNPIDENGNYLYTALDAVCFKDPYYGRPAVWLVDNVNNYTSKYVRYPAYNATFLKVVNDNAHTIFYGIAKGIVRNTRSAYEVLFQETLTTNCGTEDLGFNPDGSYANATTTWGSKFNCTATFTPNIAQLYGAVATATTVNWTAAIYYAGNMSLLTNATQYAIVTGGVGTGWLQQCYFPTPPTLVANTTYWIMFRIDTNVIKFYNNSVTTFDNETCAYATAGFSTNWASTLSPTAYFNNTIIIHTCPIYSNIRGLGIDEYITTFTGTGTNTTYAGYTCSFYTTANDGSGLSAANFRTNNTGSWINTTDYYMFPASTIESFVEFVKTLNTTYKVGVAWEIWVNDTNNNWAGTGAQYLTTWANISLSQTTQVQSTISDVRTDAVSRQGSTTEQIAISKTSMQGLSKNAPLPMQVVTTDLRAVAFTRPGVVTLNLGVSASNTIQRVLSVLAGVTMSLSEQIMRSIATTRRGVSALGVGITGLRSVTSTWSGSVTPQLGVTSTRNMGLSRPATVLLSFGTQVLRSLSVGKEARVTVQSSLASAHSLGLSRVGSVSLQFGIASLEQTRRLLSVSATTTLTSGTLSGRTILLNRVGSASLTFLVNSERQIVSAQFLQFYLSVGTQLIPSSTKAIIVNRYSMATATFAEQSLRSIGTLIRGSLPLQMVPTSIKALMSTRLSPITLQLSIGASRMANIIKESIVNSAFGLQQGRTMLFNPSGSISLAFIINSERQISSVHFLQAWLSTGMQIIPSSTRTIIVSRGSTATMTLGVQVLRSMSTLIRGAIPLQLAPTSTRQIVFTRLSPITLSMGIDVSKQTRRFLTFFADTTLSWTVQSERAILLSRAGTSTLTIAIDSVAQLISAHLLHLWLSTGLQLVPASERVIQVLWPGAGGEEYVYYMLGGFMSVPLLLALVIVTKRKVQRRETSEQE